MESPPSLETVHQALQALYNNPDVVGKERASVWLGELQRSVHAWQIADQLLTSHQSLESCYFAAQTMRTKIQYAFHELPTNVHESLRDSLLEHAGKVTADTAHVIVTQLSLALADLALQMPVWKNSVQDLVQRFGSNPSQLSFLLEVLIVLPEEISSRSLRLGANRRHEVIEELKAASQVVLELLNGCMENMSDDTQIKTKVLKLTKSVRVDYMRQLQTVFAAPSTVWRSLNYCRIFTELAESFLEVITTTPNKGLGDFRVLELLLMCVGHHQYEIAEVTFNYWYKLSEDLYQKNTPELNEEGTLDTSDDFFDFRMRVSELIKDVIFIVGSSTCFTHMFQNLKNQTSETTWDVSEASLFIMQAVAKNILPEESEVVPLVVQAVMSIPATAHIAVRYTTLQLLGELCEWIESHPSVIDPVLQYLMAGLQEPRLASVAATALQSISTMCKSHMKSHCEGLIQIVQAVDTFNISNDAATGLLKGVATILATLPHDKCTEGMRQLCSFQTVGLNKFLTEGCEAPKQGAADDPTVLLDRLAAVFRYTTPMVENGSVHPCLPVIQEVWPVLAQACNKYQADVRIVERCCRCIRFAIRCLGKSSSPLLQPLVPQMVSLYQVHSHSCFLYLGSILVDEYGSDKDCTQGLLDMYQHFCPPTFKLLEEQNGLRNHPDTVDDLFRLSLRFIQRAPLALLQSVAAKPVLMCAIAACSLDHKDANASVMKFITEFVKAATHKDEKEDFEARSGLVKGLLVEHGQALVHSLIHSIVFCLPTYMCAEISEVIYEIMQVDRATFCVWLEHVLKALPNEGTPGAIKVTHKQLTDFHKAITIAEKVLNQNFVKRLSLKLNS
ncbi:TNPO3-like protein [Mya arenaria]|uniref:TNPO3-like protein n=1 Tax=Mya arenaria TaxID=6604 RepID=A0ABY7EJD0_MYAAR|nr:TNPO3-like protein [Mya arenaria]